MAYIEPFHWPLLQVGFFVFIFFCRPNTSSFFLIRKERKDQEFTVLFFFYESITTYVTSFSRGLIALPMLAHRSSLPSTSATGLNLCLVDIAMAALQISGRSMIALADSAYIINFTRLSRFRYLSSLSPNYCEKMHDSLNTYDTIPQKWS